MRDAELMMNLLGVVNEPAPKVPEQLLLPGQAPFGKEGDVAEDDVE